eukprot:3108747-Alexandrium_andersonii.AAC.1
MGNHTGRVAAAIRRRGLPCPRERTQLLEGLPGPALVKRSSGHRPHFTSLLGADRHYVCPGPPLPTQPDAALPAGI